MRDKAIEKMKKISAMIRLYMHIHLELDIMLEYYALDIILYIHQPFSNFIGQL